MRNIKDMKNKEYSLQLLTHKSEIFATREDAIEYFNENFRPNSLIGEPALAFYGDQKSPNAIIAIGTSDRKIFCIDANDLDERISAISNSSTTEKENISNALASINEIVKACGFVVDENKIKDKITYTPDPKDKVIGNAVSLSDAVTSLSDFIQQGFSDNGIKVEDTKSITLTYSDSADGKKVLKANVKLSASGDSDNVDFNNNIICQKEDGLYAASNLEYDADKNELTFTASGIKDGKFRDDAYRKVISLGKHTEYVADNIAHSIDVKIDSEKQSISADAKLSEDANNILGLQDGKLFVDGRASNIKYEGKTVYKSIKELEAKSDTVEKSVNDIKADIDDFKKNSKIHGDTTDTVVVTATEEDTGGYHVSAGLRLGSDRTIIVKNGGIEADVELSANAKEGTLLLRCGNLTKVITLPNVDIVEDAHYDSTTKKLVIIFKNDSRVEIDMQALVKEFTFVETGPVSLIESPNDSNGNKVKAELKLSSNDNMLSVVNNELVAPKSIVTDAVKAESDRALAVEKTLTDGLSAANKAIHDETDRATAAESTLSVKLDNNIATTTAINSDVTTLKTEVVNMKAQDVALATALTTEQTRATNEEQRIESLVNSHYNEANALHDEIKTNVKDLTNKVNETKLDVTNANNAIGNEASERTRQDDIIKADVADLSADIATLNASEDTPYSVRHIVKTEYTDNLTQLIGNETDRATQKENELADKIEKFSAETNGSLADALSEAKTYTNNEVGKLSTSVNTNLEKAKVEVSKALSDDATAKTTAALSEAKSYTDAATATLTAKDTEIDSKIAELVQKDKDTDIVLSTKIGEVTVVKNSQSDLQYTLMVDGKPSGEINIPQDQFVDSVNYDETNKHITFVFITKTGNKTVEIDISDLVDNYVNGDGISLDGNKFSLKIDPSSESYLTVSENGVKLSGINDALNVKANVGDSYTKTESDSRYLTEHQDISSLATKMELNVVTDNVNRLDEKVNENISAIDIINGNYAQEGSIAKALVDANRYTDKKMEDEAVIARAAEKANADAIAIINGNEAQEGSVANAIKTSKDYIDSEIKTVETSIETTKNELKGQIDKKANADNVYTKVEIDTKGFLTQSNIDSLAAKTEVEQEAIRAKASEKANADAIASLNGQVASNATDIQLLKNESTRLSLTATESNSVKTTVSKSDTGTTINADVKLNLSGQNILKLDGNGLYANVELTYNKATNILSLNNGISTTDIQLSKQSLVTAGYYDSNTKSIVLVIAKDDGTSEKISIPVGDLMNAWNVENNDKNPIKLAKSPDANGVDTLTARLDISTESHNAILNDNGTLYASNEASKLTALWGGTEVTIQKAIEDLKTQTDKVGGMSVDIDTLKSDVQQSKTDISNLRSSVDSINSKVEQNVKDIGSNKGAIDTLKGQIINLSSDVTNLSSSFNELSNSFKQLSDKVDAQEERVSTLEADMKNVKNNLLAIGTKVNNIQNQLGTPEEEQSSVYDRLKNIEKALSDLIDFGKY